MRSAPAAPAFSITYGGVIVNPNAYSTAASDSFGGGDMAITDGRLVVTAMLEDDATGANNGKVYVINAASGSVLLTLDNPNANTSTSTNDFFGSSVAITNNNIVVGTYNESGLQRGWVYVFNADGTPAYNMPDPNIRGSSGADYFGATVAAGGNTLAVAAYGEMNATATNTNTGVVYVYDLSTGSFRYTIDNPNSVGAVSDYFGIGLAMTPSGNYIAVGAPMNAYSDGSASSGTVYIFNASSGSLVQTLENPNAYSTPANDRFGQVLAMSEEYLLVEAYGEDNANFSESVQQSSGIVYVYDTATWTLRHTLYNPDPYVGTLGDRFGGARLSISGNYATIGAPGEDEAGNLNSGKAYVFNLQTGALVATLTNPNNQGASAGDAFGQVTAMSSNTIFVSASGEDSSSGAVYKWSYTG